MPNVVDMGWIFLCLVWDPDVTLPGSAFARLGPVALRAPLIYC